MKKKYTTNYFIYIPGDIQETVEVLMVEIDKTKLSGFLCVS